MLANAKTLALAALLLALAGATKTAGLWEGDDLVNPGGWPLVARFVRAAVRPELSPDLLLLAARSALTTLAYAVCGTALSLLVGFAGGVVMAEALASKRGRAPLRALLAVPRAIHEAVWGLFFLNILGLDPLVAVLAIAVPFGAITAKVYAEIFDETPRGAFDALRRAGANKSAAFAYGLLPHGFPFLVSYGFYRFECALRAAAILGLIGAGGLGYQILLSLQSLRYEQVWTFLYALIALVGVTDACSSLVNRRLSVTRPVDGVAAFRRKHGAAATALRGRAPRLLLAAMTLLVPFSFWYIGADAGTLVSERTQRLLAALARDAFPPRFSSTALAELGVLCAQTLAMSLLGITIAALLGLLLAPSAAAVGTKRSWPVLVGARGLLLLFRALGEPIWALLVLFVLFPGVLPGALALGLYNAGVLGRLLAEVIENNDARPARALQTQGASPAQSFVYATLPQALPRYLSLVFYRGEVCLRASVIVGVVGAGGLGRRLSEELGRFDYGAVFATLLAYVVLTVLADWLSVVLRRVLR